MEFVKMQGAGNDFIMINNMDNQYKVSELQEMAKEICKRRISIGADGILAVSKAERGADFKMTYINSDGTIGEMCGNGARCTAKFAYDYGIAKENMTFEVTAGVVNAVRISEDMYKIKINNPETIELNRKITIDDKDYEVTYIELGNPGLPHAMVPYKGLEHVNFEDIFDLAKKIRYYEGFKKGANVNFYDVVDKDKVIVKTYERGVEDFTLACGTGSTSTGLTTTLLGLTSGKDVEIDVPGGILKVNVDMKDDKVVGLYLTGPAKKVYSGEF